AGGSSTRRVSRGWRGAALRAGLAAATSCRDATQITVVLSTDARCPDVHDLAIKAGGGDEPLAEKDPASRTSPPACAEGGALGTIVLVPSGDTNARVSFEIVADLGATGDACSGPRYGPTCIVARRTLRYIPHESLRVAVRLGV